MRLFVGICALLMLSGCMVGPRYQRPQVVIPQSYQQNTGKLSLETSQDLSRWWDIFGDECLKSLIQKAVVQNYDLRRAVEKIEEFRALYGIQYARLFPQVDGIAEASKGRFIQEIAQNNGLNNLITNQNIVPNNLSSNFLQIGIEVLWELDFWGRIRHASNAAYAQFEAQIEETRDVYVLLLSDVASAHIEICALKTLITLRTERVAVDTTLLALEEDRFQAGIDSEVEVQIIKAQLEESKSSVLLLKTILVQTTNGLAILLGELPETFSKGNECAQISRAVPEPQEELRVGLPSDLLRRRPDIRGAERLLAAATEQVGVAVSEYFPRFSLLGDVGTQGTCISGLGFQWFLGCLVRWPLITFGRIRFKVEAAESVQRQALLTYGQTVLKAFKDVEDALVAYFNETEQLTLLTNKLRAIVRERDLIRDRFLAGLVGERFYLLAERNRIDAEVQVTQMRQARSLSLVRVYKALGGGWSGSEEKNV